jgi:hypothetical protein
VDSWMVVLLSVVSTSRGELYGAFRCVDSSKNCQFRTGKFLIPIKYRNCIFYLLACDVRYMWWGFFWGGIRMFLNKNNRVRIAEREII